MSYSMDLDSTTTPSLVRVQLGEEFTGEDFDKWLEEYDQIMSKQTVLTDVIVDTSENKSVHNAIRRMFSKMDFPTKYPQLGWTVIWGDSRIMATTVKFVRIANSNLKIRYEQNEEDALAFLADPSEN
jgi:hypothetical protein